jgi:hypothetical protein
MSVVETDLKSKLLPFFNKKKFTFNPSEGNEVLGIIPTDHGFFNDDISSK